MGVSNHTSVIQKDGSLWAWGYNAQGQLGDNTKVNKLIPTKIGTDKWKQISVGISHTACLREDGSLWAWGLNNYGQLGDNTKVEKLVPTKAGDDKWKQISVGTNYTTGIQEDGSLWTWGLNNYGQLGDNTIVDKLVPTKIGDDKWKQISVGASYTAGIQEDGSLWAWGQNNYGQLGDNTRVDKLIPTKIGDAKWKQISVGAYHAIGIQEDGGLWSWGRNNYGQLGDNTTVNKSVPTKIGDDKWKQITTGNYHSIGIQEDGSLWAWGRNANGQLGDNTTVDKLVPTKIDIDKVAILMDIILSIVNKSFLLSSDGYKKLSQGSNEITVYSENLIPQMTSNTTPSGTVSASAVNPSLPDQAWKAFDRSVNTANRDYWYTGIVNSVSGGHWLKYDFGIGIKKKINRISLMTFSRFLKDFILYGSNDDTTYVEIFKGAQLDNTDKQLYSFQNNIEYRYYRINVISNNDTTNTYPNNVSIVEMEMMEGTIVTPATLPSWKTVSSILPSLTQFQEEGMDDLSIFDRKVQTVMEGPKTMTSEVLGEGKVYKTSVNLNKYFDLRKLEVK